MARGLPVVGVVSRGCGPGGAGAMAEQGSGDSGGDRAGRALPPHSPSGVVLQTVEMHTGGEPLRIIPRLEAAEQAAAAGLSLLSLRREVAARQDHVRRALMHEPRGHAGMYGAVVVRGAAAAEGAHLAALFLHCAGYSAMCGHAVIALGRFALDYGLVAAPTRPETAVLLRCPCGPVTAFVPWDGRRSGNPVRFHSVPAFAAATGGDQWVCGGLVVAWLSEGHLLVISLVPLFFRGHRGCCKVLWEYSSYYPHPLSSHVAGFLHSVQTRGSAVLPPHFPPFLCSDLAIDVPGHGKVVVDIGYGGTFYAFLSAEQLGLDVCSSKTRDLVSAASAVTEAVKKQVWVSTVASQHVPFAVTAPDRDAQHGGRVPSSWPHVEFQSPYKDRRLCLCYLRSRDGNTAIYLCPLPLVSHRSCTAHIVLLCVFVTLSVLFPVQASSP